MATKSRNLRTGRSIWPHPASSKLHSRRLTRDLSTDVLVIGAGITGAMVADALAADGRDVVVVDRRGAAKGSTAASTALVQYEIDQPLTRLSRQIGQANAVRAWRRTRLAVDALAARLSEIGATGIRHSSSLYIAGNMLDAHALKREGDARRRAGLETAFLMRSEIANRFGVSATAALLSFDNLSIDPRKATFTFLNEAKGNGARLYSPVDIVRVERSARQMSAISSDGHRIRCKHLVFATGYETPDGIPRDGHHVISTWAIATVPQRRMPCPNLMLWEAAEPYVYLRCAGRRIICGGEDEPFSDDKKRDELIARKTAALQKKLHKLLPKADTRIDYAWAGSFGASRDGLPFIGRIPGKPRCWAAMGYGGNGTTYSRIAAEIIRAGVAGHDDPDADLYALRRRRKR
ncbi:MAG: NAD(P)/FAD-dependent oxidoreductase [Xanthobacteraceae bacterium]